MEVQRNSQDTVDFAGGALTAAVEEEEGGEELGRTVRHLNKYDTCERRKKELLSSLGDAQ